MPETTSRPCSASDADDKHVPEQTGSCSSDEARALRSQLETLRLEAHRAERACDVALGRELEAQEEVVQLRAQVEALESQVEALSREKCETAGDEQVCSTAQQPAGGAPQRSEGPRSQLLEAQAEIARLTERLGAAEAARQELESAASHLRDTAAAAEAGAQREARRRQRAEREGKEARASLDARQAELRERKVAALQTSERLERLQGALRAADAAAEQLRRERDLQTEALTRAKREAEAHAAAQGQLKAQLRDQEAALEAERAVCQDLRTQILRASKGRDEQVLGRQALQSEAAQLAALCDQHRAEAAQARAELAGARHGIARLLAEQERRARGEER